MEHTILLENIYIPIFQFSKIILKIRISKNSGIIRHNYT